MNFDYQDITIVSKQANVSRMESEKALIQTRGDLTKAVLLLTRK